MAKLLRILATQVMLRGGCVPGFVLEDGTCLLAARLVLGEQYVGGTVTDGVYTPTAERYTPVFRGRLCAGFVRTPKGG